MLNVKISHYLTNITSDYLEKKLSSTEIMVLIHVLSQSGTGKHNFNVITLDDVETTFKLKKQRVQQILNKLKEHDYVSPIYKVTTLKYNNETFPTYNKARAFQKRKGGQVYFYGVKLKRDK